MDRIGDPQTPTPSSPVRVVQISVQPKTWWGKLLACILGAAIALAAFFVSVVALVIVACIVVAAGIYLVWTTRHARRAMRDRIIDAEVERSDIR